MCLIHECVGTRMVTRTQMPHVSSTFEVGGGAGARTWQWRSAYRISCSSRSSYAMSHVTATQMGDVCGLSCARADARVSTGFTKRRKRQNTETAETGRGGSWRRARPSRHARNRPTSSVHSLSQTRTPTIVCRKPRCTRSSALRCCPTLSPPPPLSLSLARSRYIRRCSEWWSRLEVGGISEQGRRRRKEPSRTDLGLTPRHRATCLHLGALTRRRRR
jgi:hypothetical protein